MLPVVDIVERKYIDYFTFHAFDVEKDVEAELDYGNYTTDIMGYLLDKGYTVWLGMNASNKEMTGELLIEEMNQIGGGFEDVAYEGELRLNGQNIFWYVHNSKECVYTGQFGSPWNIDIDDVVSINVFDEPTSLYNISKEAPLYMEMIKKHINLKAQTQLTQGIGDRASMKYYLIDVLIKEDYELRTMNEKRDLGKRVTTLTGISQTSQFYSPQYPDGPIEGTKDYRRTLYWNPNVVTDENGHAEVEFYNNSYSTHFRVTGAGITASGTPYVLDSAF